MRPDVSSCSSEHVVRREARRSRRGGLASRTIAYVFTTMAPTSPTPAVHHAVLYGLDDTPMPTRRPRGNYAPYDFAGTNRFGWTALGLDTTKLAQRQRTTITESVTKTSGAIESATATFPLGQRTARYHVRRAGAELRSISAGCGGALLACGSCPSPATPAGQANRVLARADMNPTTGVATNGSYH